MIDFLINIDTQVLLFFNGLHSPLMDSFMMMFTGRFVWVPMYLSILYILFTKYKTRDALLLTVVIAGCILFADQVCASLLRPEFERLRPAHPENPVSAMVHIVDGYRGGRYGFPSCHGSNSFALATILALIVRVPRFTRFIFVWATVNAYTRLYLGVHYPGDLIVGAMIGSLGSLMIWWVAKRFVGETQSEDGTQILFAAPTGPLEPVMRLRIVNIRAFDVLPAVGATTMILLFAIACFNS